MSSALGLEPGSDRQASGLRCSLAGKAWGRNRAGSLGVRVGNEQQRPSLAAPRWQQPHLRTGGGRDCEAEIWRSRSGAKSKRIAWWERRGSGGLRERDASRRSGGSPRAYVRRYGGASASGTGKARVGPVGRRRVEGNVTRAFGYLYEEDTEIASRTPRLDQKERLRHYSLEVSRIL